MTPARAPEPLAQPDVRGPAHVPPFSAMLGSGMIPMIASSPVIVLVFSVTRQAHGGLASLLGVLTAMAFFAIGIVVVSRLTKANPLSLLVAAVSVYVGQVTFLGVVILTLSRARWVDGTAFALSVLVIALVWQLSLVRAFVRLRKPVYDEPRQAPLNEQAEPPDEQPSL